MSSSLRVITSYGVYCAHGRARWRNFTFQSTQHVFNEIKIKLHTYVIADFSERRFRKTII